MVIPARVDTTPDVSSQPSPFLKWAGGKSQLISQYQSFFPSEFTTYFEPFLGGGAVFFHLQPQKAVLTDINEELVNTYRVVRDAVEDLIQHLRIHQNESTYYYRVRSQDPSRLFPIERASRFIYLNKTCYNGLYRVNREGQFNVPFGSYKKPNVCDAENLKATSIALREALIFVADFEKALKRANKGDLVYLDPPYQPLNDTAKFTHYAEGGFDERAQRRLAKVVSELDARGCLVMVSNSDTALVRELYQGLNVDEVSARRAINCRGDRRGVIQELVIRNYK